MDAKIYHEIEKIMSRNLIIRGMDQAFIEGELRNAALELYQSETVVVLTGFVIKEFLVGETDGPIGALSVAHALETLGKRVVIATDSYSYNMIKIASQSNGFKGEIIEVPYKDTEVFLTRLLNQYQPTHILSIERPGRSKNGCFYSMNGIDMTDIVPDTDIMFTLAKKMGITTIAIGDGGNELGMGKAYSKIIDHVKNGHLICATVSSDYLLVAQVSNWGGHALVAALSILSGQSLLHDVDVEKKLLTALIDEGAIDGMTKKKMMTVDGLSMEENFLILNELIKAVKDYQIN